MENNTDTAINSLPMELIELICEYCEYKAVVEYLPGTAKVFTAVLAKDKFWKNRCALKIAKLIKQDETKSWKYNYQSKVGFIIPPLLFRSLQHLARRRRKTDETVL